MISMELIKYAEEELTKWGAFNKDSIYGGMVGKAVMELIKVFFDQGHSGMSASIVLNLFKKLASFKPLSHITGEEDEWNIVSFDNWETVALSENAEEEAEQIQKILDEKPEQAIYQNKRIGGVFKKGKNGIPYYIDAIVFKGEEDYDTFTGRVETITSKQYINLPFEPKTFYIDVIREFHSLEWFESNNISYYETAYINNDTNKPDYYFYKIKDKEQLKEVYKYYKNEEDNS